MALSENWFELAGVALQRAALRAREIAKQTGTGIIVMHEGEMLRITFAPDGSEIRTVLKTKEELASSK